jgi:type IV secretory pathway VirB3-like protein
MQTGKKRPGYASPGDLVVYTERYVSGTTMRRVEKIGVFLHVGQRLPVLNEPKNKGIILGCNGKIIEVDPTEFWRA